MGWRGTVRSVRAAYRAAERDKVRQQKIYEKEEKQFQKEIEREDAREEFEEYQKYCCSLISLHGNISKEINWVKIFVTEKPPKPRNNKKNENKASVDLKNYKPRFFDKLFRLAERKKSKLSLKVIDAVKRDEEVYLKKKKEWEELFEAWEKKNSFAKRIKENDFKTKIEVLENYFDSTELEDLGIDIDFDQEDKEVRITVQSTGVDLIPNQIKSILQSGKLSTKKMPVGKYYEMYQDHICSVVLKCAGEFFSIIPDKRVFIDVMDELLDKKTGHKKTVPILSVCVSRSTISGLNLKRVDPSDCMTNFIHNMIFRKTKGFEEVLLVKVD